MSLPDKAMSVGADGQPDGFVPAASWSAEIIPGSHTRLVVSLPGHRLEAVHRALVSKLEAPLRVLYVQLVDRVGGQQLDPPKRLVALEIESCAIDEALAENRRLIYHDGRHQLWVQGKGPDKVVLEETGVMYVYPDDPLFRETLEGLGLPEIESQNMAQRDYVRVTFSAEADAQEVAFHRAMGLVPYGS
jgi:hypothetical protein